MVDLLKEPGQIGNAALIIDFFLQVEQFLAEFLFADARRFFPDARQLLDGWITITPLRPNLTARDLVADAAAVLEQG